MLCEQLISFELQLIPGMTVTYSDGVGALLCRWRGSLYKTVWKELVFFLIIYYIIRFSYLYLLNEEQQTTFENLVMIFERRLGSSFTLTFILGFYVSSIVTRWWSQVQLIVWPDQLVSYSSFIFSGDDRESRLSRHQIARYLILTCVLAWRQISIRVKKRFPTDQHIVKSGLLTETELKMYENSSNQASRWMVPLEWVMMMVRKRLDAGKCFPPNANGFIMELADYRQSFRELFCYDWICIPLVYTQVTALATYSYFIFCLVAKQYLIPGKYDDYKIDLHFPIFTVMEFLFYVGWFKVGQELMKPFGEDDDDTELNFILDRHLRVVMALANDVWKVGCPDLVEDKFWGHVTNSMSLVHTKSSMKIREHLPKSNVRLPKHMNVDTVEEAKEENNATPSVVVQTTAAISGFAQRITRLKSHIPYLNSRRARHLDAQLHF